MCFCVLRFFVLLRFRVSVFPCYCALMFVHLCVNDSVLYVFYLHIYMTLFCIFVWNRSHIFIICMFIKKVNCYSVQISRPHFIYTYQSLAFLCLHKTPPSLKRFLRLTEMLSKKGLSLKYYLQKHPFYRHASDTAFKPFILIIQPYRSS